MKQLMIILVVALLIAHQDYWNWNNGTLMFGFLPMGLYYHLGISLAAALVWLIGVTFAWPRSFTELDAAILKSSQTAKPVVESASKQREAD